MVTIDQAEPIASVACKNCGTPFEYDEAVVRIPGRGVIFARRLCDACQEAQDAELRAIEEQAKLQEHSQAWQKICPPLYRNTDKAKIPMPAEILTQVLNYQPQQKGLGLTGMTGTGKTRAVFLLLKRLHEEGKGVIATSAKQFEHWCHRMFEKDDDARVHLNASRKIAVLFIDDIGKEKYTERVESEFYDLIEYRTSHLLPILWTANASGKQIVQMMSGDRGVPIVRRLREFSTILSIG